jgi:hypothetical protein
MNRETICADNEKQAPYVAPGAKELRRCDTGGGMTFHNSHAVPAHSVPVPDLPHRVTLPF